MSSSLPVFDLFCSWDVGILLMFLISISYQLCDLCFLPFCGLPFYTADSVPFANVLKFNVQSVYLLFCCLMLMLSYSGSHCQMQCHKDFALFSSKSFSSYIWVHSGLMFAYSEGGGSSSFLGMWTFSFPSTICWRECPFPTEWSCILVKNHLIISVGVYFQVESLVFMSVSCDT